MFEMTQGLLIDEAGKFTLTKYANRAGNKTAVIQSDHKTLIMEVDIKWKSKNQDQSQRKEVYNFKDKEGFERFVNLTECNNELRHCFDKTEDIEAASKKWLKMIQSCIKKSFKKVRIKESRIKPSLELLFQRKEKKKADIAVLENLEHYEEVLKLKDLIDSIDDEISSNCADNNRSLVTEYLEKYDDNHEGFSQVKTWALRKKLAPKSTAKQPAAKKDLEGKLITKREDLEHFYLKTYESRLQHNPVSEDIRYELAKGDVTENWTGGELEKSLKSLKNNKARDAHGLVYELFKYGGKDLKFSLLAFFNKVKMSQTYPTILQDSNITSFWKKKGDRSNIENDRGIFNVTKIRSILDKMVYNDIYDEVDGSMSSSNIGARRNRNIRDHLFVVNGIINESINGKNKTPIVLQIYDISKCFDKLEYVNTANDFYSAGVTSDKFVLIANSNKKCNVGIRTPWGVTSEKLVLENIEMQGTVLAPLKC